jgi:transcription antitermination factor NusG
VKRAWAEEDAGASPREAFERDARAEREAEEANARALEERRAARREKRGGTPRAMRATEAKRHLGMSIAATTREVEAMKEAGASVVQREFLVQRAMSEAATGEGWYMLEVPETRENQAKAAILALNGTKLTRGQGEVVAWVPRVPADGFYVAEEDAVGKSELELCQMVEEEDMIEMLQPGYVLVRCALTQELMDAFDDLRSVRGFATGGSSRFGKKKYEKLNTPLTMDDQIPRMIERCLPVVKTEADIEAEKAREQAKEVMRAERGDEADEADAGDMRPVASREEASGSVDRVEVHTGPFKGFKGHIVARNDDGSVEATLAIFGRDTNVSLAADEFNCI